MAYEIISQNNTTTTLSDGTNTITVPARVTLATSTSYTISEVNNNTATLEGSDGSVIRDVPCVVVLAGEGGGGSDQHNLGYYADLTALQTAHPTGTDGDFAILGSTDTIWVWDSGTSAWKDTDTKGQVTSVNGQTGDVVLDLLPSQTGQSGKFLTTDGTAASWSDKPLLNKATGEDCLSILGGVTTGYRNTNIGSSSLASGSDNTALGNQSEVHGDGSIAIGYITKVTNVGTYGTGIAIGRIATVSATGAIQLSANQSSATNSDANTFKVANNNGNFEIMSADGTIPTDRLTNAINKYSTMPTAASTNVGWIVQFTGATDSTYTHGYIYECKAQGTDPETYAWEAVEVQAGSGGGLPSQTGNAGKFLTTDGTDASWATVDTLPSQTGNSGKFLTTDGTNASWANALVNTATRVGYGLTIMGTPTTSSYGLNIGRGSDAGSDGSIAIGRETKGTGSSAVGIGDYAEATGSESCAVGYYSKGTGQNSVGLGRYAQATAKYAIQLGAGTNSTANTFQVGSYRLLDADGTIPAARHATLPAADGTYTLQLVIADGVPTLSWVAV